LNSSAVATTVAENMLLEKVTLNVIKQVVVTINHFRNGDQFFGFSGSDGPSHETISCFSLGETLLNSSTGRISSLLSGFHFLDAVVEEASFVDGDRLSA
jgi:hypothetical protein